MSVDCYGRSITLEWGGVLFKKGLQEKGITINGEAAEITSDEDGGYRTLCDTDAVRSVDVSISGVLLEAGAQLFRADKLNQTVQKTLKITWPDGATLQGLFNLGAFEEGATTSEVRTFSSTFLSSGEFTYTPPTP